MRNLSRLRRTLRLATDLTSVVGTMKTLAAVNIRQFEAAAASIDEYVETVELGLQVALDQVEPEPPVPPSRHGWIVVGSDQGLCGGFNERVSVLAADRIAASPGPSVVVGHRVARRLEADGFVPELELRTPGSTDGIIELVTELLQVVSDWQEGGAIDALWIVHNQSRHDVGVDAIVAPLLPLDADWLSRLRDRPWESRVQPTHPHDAHELFRWLVREWLFARIYLACASSLAAENAARLVATQAAERSLHERARDLRVSYRNERQQAITEELLDLHRS